MELDTKEQKILSILDFNARASNTQIARMTKLSRDVVNYRIKQMEANGMVQGYYTVVDVSKLGYFYCRLLLRFNKTTTTLENRLMAFVKQNTTIVWVGMGDGKYDFYLVLLAKDLVEIEKISSAIYQSFCDIVKNVIMSLALRVHVFPYDFLYGKYMSEYIIESGNKAVKLDTTDLKLLSLLSANARCPLTELGEQLKINPNTVKYKLNQLIAKKVILGFRAKINIKLLGYDHFKIFLYLKNKDPAIKKKVCAYLKEQLHVVYVTEALGISDLEFEIMMKGSQVLFKELNKIRTLFPIDDYEIVMIYDEPVLAYLPRDLS